MFEGRYHVIIGKAEGILESLDYQGIQNSLIDDKMDKIKSNLNPVQVIMVLN